MPERPLYQPDSEQLRDFEVLLRNNRSSERMHPTLKRRQDEADIIIAKINQHELPEYVPSSLIPHPADQGLTLTPFDEFDGMHIEIPSEEQVEAWEMQGDFNLHLANHPVRLTAMRQLEAEGFKAPPKIDGLLQKALEDGEPLQLSDLAQNTDFVRLHHTPLELNDNSKTLFVDQAILKRQAHRTDLLATGPYSFIGRRVRSTIGSGAMPDIMGSVAAITTMVQMGGIGHVPEVGKYRIIQNQTALAKAAIDNANDPNNPLFASRSEEDIAFMKDLWTSSIVGVVEVNSAKALKRAEALAEVGVRSFRVYGHTQGGDVVATTRELRREFPDAEIFASQITNVTTALACEYVGADAIIVGVGSGGRCSTADRAQLIPSNAHLPWALRGELNIPIIGEGGAIDEPVVSLLAGMSGMYGSGSLGGGTFEAPGGIYYLKDQEGRLVKPYGGEASDRFKTLSGRIYGGTGLPYFSEGKQTFKPLTPYRESMTQNVIDKWEDIILGAVVMGVDKGPFTIQALQAMNPSPLWKKSGTTQLLQKPH